MYLKNQNIFYLAKPANFVYLIQDEIASSHSISFNHDGSKIYCGFNNCIRIFDSARPGRQFREQSIIRMYMF